MAADVTAGSADETNEALRDGFEHQKAGRLAEAEAAYRRALALHPDHPDALHLLGVVARARKDVAGAVALIEKAIAVKPNAAEFHNNLGNALKDQGRVDEAVRAYRRAVALKPGFAHAHFNLGNTYKTQGHIGVAIDAYRQALAHQPDIVQAHAALGDALFLAGRLDEAIASCREAIRLRPDVAEAHFTLGRALQQRGAIDDAVGALGRAVELQPDHAEALHALGYIEYERGQAATAIALLQRAIAARPDDATYHSNIGEMLRASGQHDAAVAACRKAVTLAPGHRHAYCNLGNALRETGDLDGAITALRRAIALNPELPQAHNGLAAALHQQGDFDEAVASYRRAVELQPGFASAYHNLSGLKTFTAGDPDIDAMERLISDPGMADSDKAFLSFALGKAYDDQEAFDQAFAFYRRGNRLRRGAIDFDIRHTEALFDRIIATFDTALMKRFAGAGRESELPVFIVGMPRSGTSLIEQILASHPRVHGAGELNLLLAGLGGLAGRLGSMLPFPDCVADADAAGWRAVGEQHVAALRSLDGTAARVTDKMPANFQIVGLIRLMLPGARFIHCRRDPLDTGVSCFSTLFTAGQDFTYDLAELGHYYRQYDRLMRHWTDLLGDAVLEVRYEDVVADLEGKARELVAFCGLDWDDACLAFHETRRAVHTASAAQVRRPIYSSSIGRWRRYERHLGPLIEALGPLAPP